MLLATVTLDSETSKKKQLINQADLLVITAPHPDFDETFPFCDVDGGDTLIFLPTSNFLDNIHNATMKAPTKAKKPLPPNSPTRSVN